MQIGSLVILEMNKTGSTLFWAAADPMMPGFYQSEYNRSALLERCPSGGPARTERFRLTHVPPGGWQPKYRKAIQDRANLSLS